MEGPAAPMRPTPDIRSTGEYRASAAGHRAFHPAPLPPDPPIRMGATLVRLLSEADRGVAGLDSATDLLPDPDGFVYSYVRREAVLSSQIEGTQSSLDDLVQREAGVHNAARPRDVEEVSNYVAALNAAMAALPDLPVSGRLIRDAHRRLMQGVRGGDRTPGEFRRHQVHIGPAGGGLADAVFVPPPADAVGEAMAALERYLHAPEDEVAEPALIRIGLAHAQFETIHPFADGNGRCGRLLTSLLLSEKRLLRRPVLYLSAFFRKNREAYYAHLQGTRDRGDFEGWLEFFLRGVAETAADARDRARRIVLLREEHRTNIIEHLQGSAAKAFRLLDLLFRRPYFSIPSAAQDLDVTYPTASKLVTVMEGLGIVREVTGWARHRIFVYQPYIDIFRDEGT
jgi:Fic family protein